MHVHRLKTFGAVLALSGLAALAAVTVSGPAPGADTAKEAEDHFNKGKALLKDGDKKGAYQEYKAAWTLKRTYDIAANLGNVEADLGMPRDAAEHLSFALKNAAVSVPADRLDRIRKLIDQQKQLVGTVAIHASIDGAEILVNGVSVGRSPLGDEVYVDPGPVVVEARLSPFQPASQKVECSRATTTKVDLVLSLAGPVATGAPTATPTALPTASASAVPTAPPESKSMIPVGVGAGVAAAGLGLGIVGLVISGAKGSDITSLQATLKAKDNGSYTVCSRAAPPSECADLDGAFTGKGSFRNLAIIGFATAGVAALATVTYVLVPGPKPAAGATGAAGARVKASFSAGPNGGGALITGQF
jgi:PEGA domain